MFFVKNIANMHRLSDVMHFFAGTKISHLLNTVKAEGADPSPTVSLTGKKRFFF